MTFLLAYAAILLIVLAIVAASGNETLLKLQLVAVAHWGAYNVVISKLGYDYGVLLACLSCLAAIVSVIIGLQTRSWVALGIVMLWIAGAAITTAFFYFRMQMAYMHYLGLNVTFLARMALVGGAGVAELVRRAHALSVGAHPRLRRS